MIERIVGAIATTVAGLIVFFAAVSVLLLLGSSAFWLTWNHGIAPFDGVGRVTLEQSAALMAFTALMRLILFPVSNLVAPSKSA